MIRTGTWWAGCSIPKRAAAEALKRVSVNGNIACFLAPTLAAQIAYALDRLKRTQGLIALIPDTRDLWVMLHSHDFSSEFDRFWIVTSQQWEAELEKLLDQCPGILGPEPVSFGSTHPHKNTSMRWWKNAQECFRRSRRNAPTNPARCVSASCERVHRSSEFASSRRRSFDFGTTRVNYFPNTATQSGIAIERFDPDRPADSLPLAFTRIASACDVVFGAQHRRADLPALTSDDLPWITWLTSSRIPRTAIRAID